MLQIKTQVKHQKIVFFRDVDKDKIPKYHCEESDKVDGVSCKIGFHYVHKYFYATDVFSLNDARFKFDKKYDQKPFYIRFDGRQRNTDNYQNIWFIQNSENLLLELVKI